MTVQVPFELRRRSAVSPASAAFVPTRDASTLLAVCTSLSLDPTGRVFDVAGGFLLKLERPTADPLPGVTRLCELTQDFYLPVDADLVPALLDDEAAGLVRNGGLVFLPGRRILAFDRGAAIDLVGLTKAEPRPRRAWAPLPEPSHHADRLVEIVFELPDVPPEALYEEFEQDLRRAGSHGGGSRGGDDPGVDDGGTHEGSKNLGEPGTPDAALEGTGTKRAGNASARGLFSGVQGLAGSLRGFVGRAGAGFSAFKEKIQWEWIDHSSLVRKLLQEFREGDPSRRPAACLPDGTG